MGVSRLIKAGPRALLIRLQALSAACAESPDTAGIRDARLREAPYTHAGPEA